MDLHYLPAHVLAEKIKNKEISSLELTQHYIERIEKYDGDINSVIVKIFDEAILAAKEADEAISKKQELNILHGVPMTINETKRTIARLKTLIERKNA